MSVGIVVSITLVIAVLGYSVYVLRRIRRSVCFTRKQKCTQTLIVITVPLFGAWFIHAMYRSDEEIPLKEDKDFIPSQGSEHS